MSIWLQKRLAAWMGVSLCGGALLWSGGALRAQSNSDSAATDVGFARIELSRDQAARNFVLLLQNDRLQGFPLSALDLTQASSVSTKSERELKAGIRLLLLQMSAQWQQQQTKVTVQNEAENTATVTVAPDLAPKPLPLILVQENGSWGIDLLETYAQWNGLDGAAKTRYLAQLNRTISDARESGIRASCQSNLRQIGLGLNQYLQDNNGRFPPAQKWTGLVNPYVKSDEQLFKCPVVMDKKGNGYAFNTSLSHLAGVRLRQPYKIVSFYETTLLKRNAYGLGENLAFRHQNGANFAFADGHVKWFPKTAIPSFKLKP